MPIGSNSTVQSPAVLKKITGAANVGVDNQGVSGTIQSYITGLVRSDFSALAGLDISTISDGQLCFISDSNHGGVGRFVNSTAHGITDTVGVTVRITDDWYWLRDTSSAQLVNVKWFGAVGDGVTDDYNAFVLAIAHSQFIGMPKGTYVVSGNIELFNRETLKGMTGNHEDVIIRPTAAVTRALYISSRVKIADFTIDGVDTNNSDGLLVSMGDDPIGNVINAYDILITQFYGTGYGVQVREVVGANFDHVRTVDCDNGLLVQGDTGSLPTYLNFNNCAFRAGGRGIQINRGYGVVFNNCLMEDNSLEGARIDTIDVVERVHFNNCWIERNYQSSSSNYNVVVDGTNPGASTKHVTFNDTYFYPASVSKAAHFSKALQVRFSGNTIPSSAGSVLFDTNSNGWISEQEENTATGAIVDSTGFMIDDAVSLSAWTTPTFNAANFTTEAGDITVAAADVAVYDYKIIGKTMYLNINIDAFSLSAGTQWVAIAIPSGKTSKNNWVTPCYLSNNGTREIGFANASAAGSVVFMRRVSLGDMAASANNSGVSVNLVFEIN